MIKRMVVLVVAVVASLFGGLTTAAAAAPACAYVASYTHEGNYGPAAPSQTATERGPPATYDYVDARSPADPWSSGASAHLDANTPGVAYDHPMLLVQVARDTTTAEAARGVWRARASLQRSEVAADSAAPLIKAGSEGGESAGKAFSQRIRQEALEENPSTCVYCHMETDSPQIDHAIPRSRGGNATIENAQTTCGWCNASKGARDFPVNPPPGFEGMWPPSWWGFLF